MSLGLSVLICILSAGMLAGRIYEILRLTDPSTGFLITKGIAFNPLLLAISIVVAVCCGVVIFGAEKENEPFYSKGSGIIAAAAGSAFAAYGIMVISQSKSAVFIIAGGTALCMMGLTGLGTKIKDYIILALLTAFVAGMCLDVIIFDVYTIHNTAFMHKVLAYASIILVLCAVLRNVYAPSRFSPMMLYISGFLCFAFSGMFSIAEVICFIVSGSGFTVDIVEDIAMIIFGIYALDNALSVLPVGVEITEKEEGEVPVNPVEENTSSEPENTPPATQDSGKMLFRGGEVKRSSNEKIVYKRPKN